MQPLIKSFYRGIIKCFKKSIYKFTELKKKIKFNIFSIQLPINLYSFQSAGGGCISVSFME